MRRRGVAALAQLVVTIVVAACGAIGHPGAQACTLVGVRHHALVQVLVPTAVRERLRRVRVTFCQGGRCRSTDSRRRSVDAPTAFDHGVELRGDRLGFGERAFAVGVRDRRTTMHLVGLASDGSTIVDTKRSFRLRHYYPNGKDCPPDVLRAEVSLAG